MTLNSGVNYASIDLLFVTSAGIQINDPNNILRYIYVRTNSGAQIYRYPDNIIFPKLDYQRFIFSAQRKGDIQIVTL